MEEQIILQYAKDWVAVENGFKSWRDIDDTLNTGWTHDGAVQEADLLDDVSLKYGELLLHWRVVGVHPPYPEDIKYPELHYLLMQNATEGNSIFTQHALVCMQSGMDKNEVILSLISKCTEVFDKFKKLMTAWPIQYSKLPDL